MRYIQEFQNGTRVASLAGIVSFGAGCARPFQPGIYTRVSAYDRWIQSIVGFSGGIGGNGSGSDDDRDLEPPTPTASAGSQIGFIGTPVGITIVVCSCILVGLLIVVGVFSMSGTSRFVRTLS